MKTEPLSYPPSKARGCQDEATKTKKEKQQPRRSMGSGSAYTDGKHCMSATLLHRKQENRIEQDRKKTNKHGVNHQLG